MATGTAILEAFYQAAGQFVAPSQLKLSADELACEIAELRQLGYSIESHPHFGYRLLSAPDRLTADDIKARVHTAVIGREILVFDETSSTNDVVEHMARSRAAEGLVVFAESQTKGRGRHGREWVSPHGKGLWFSVLLRPRFPLPRVTVAASVAVARVTGREARIKWPNDVTLDGRKVAGILTETRYDVAILGIGVNVNCEHFPEGLNAGSLFGDRLEIAGRLLSELDALYEQAAHDFAGIAAEWARLSTTLGRQLVISMGERRIEGHAQALDDDGALLLRRDDGRIERILGADVTVEK